MTKHSWKSAYPFFQYVCRNCGILAHDQDMREKVPCFPNDAVLFLGPPPEPVGNLEDKDETERRFRRAMQERP